MTANPYPGLDDEQYNAIAHAEYGKSSFSGSQGCITLAAVGDMIGLQDDKLPEDTRSAHTLVFSRDELAAFLRGAKNGEFDDLV